MTLTSAEINVQGAFELLIESLGEEVNFINRAGAQAFERGDYPAVDELRGRADAATALREKVLALREEWERMAPTPEEQAEEEGVPTSRRDLGRLPKGVRTPERKFEAPILTALVELGGKARVGDVLARVEQQMRGALKEIDYQPVPSDPDTPRWRNSALWTRFSLVQRGDLKPDCPRGVWEITEQGRRHLRESTASEGNG